MKLKGKLVIIGGAEDKGAAKDESNIDDFIHHGILDRIVEESAHKKKSRIEVVTTASSVPNQVGKDYIKAFKLLGANNVGVIHIETREGAESPDFLKRLANAAMVFFTGGDQIRLTSILGGTTFFGMLVEKLRTNSHFIYAGTSAGAAAASESMICNGNSGDAIRKGEVKTATGFGLVENVVFDTHFIERGRIGRLFQIIVTNPKILGVGLEENTGLLIHNNMMEAIGPGMTIIIDGRGIKNNNLLEIRDGAPISIDSLQLSVMSKTDVYNLSERALKILTPEECRI